MAKRPLSLQTALRLKSWLYNHSGQMPPMKVSEYWVRLTRYYLTALASGVRALSTEDIDLVERFLDAWEERP